MPVPWIAYLGLAVLAVALATPLVVAARRGRRAFGLAVAALGALAGVLGLPVVGRYGCALCGSGWSVFPVPAGLGVLAAALVARALARRLGPAWCVAAAAVAALPLWRLGLYWWAS